MFSDKRLNNKKFLNGNYKNKKHIILNGIDSDDDLKCKNCGKPLKYYVLKKEWNGYVNIKGCGCLMNKLGNKSYIQSIVGIMNIDTYWNEKKQRQKNRIGKKVLNEFVEKYGYIDGNIKYDEWKIKCDNSLKGFIHRFGDIDGLKKYNEFQKKSDNKSINYFIKKYGEVEGKIKYDNTCKNMSKNNYFTFNWWLNKYDDYKVAMKQYLKSQVRDLCYFVEKYGDIYGKIKYDNMCKKRNFNKTLDGFILRFGKEQGTIKYNKYRNEVYKKTIATKSFNTYSIISLELFNALSKILNYNYLYHTNEFNVVINNKQYYYDFTDIINKKIIEFNGDFWHCNPKLYNENYIHPISKMNVIDIWNNDKNKIDIIKNQGFDVMVVWESDYLKNKQKIINDCINFLKG